MNFTSRILIVSEDKALRKIPLYFHKREGEINHFEIYLVLLFSLTKVCLLRKVFCQSPMHMEERKYPTSASYCLLMSPKGAGWGEEEIS